MSAPNASETSYGGNPARAAEGWPNAVIGGAWRTGVLGMRSMYRRGVKAFCFDTGNKYEGFRSKYGTGYSCPNPDTDPDAWVEFMIKLAGRMDARPVLIPSSDQYVSAFAKHEAILSQHYIMSPGVRLQGLLAEKQTQYQLAAEHGMPMPRTEYAHSMDDVVAFARDAVFPCLLKPIHFRQWQAFPPGHPLSFEKIAIANNPAELQQHWKLASAIDPNVLLQEIIEGRDTAKRYYVSAYDRDGKRIANTLFRELRCHPVEFGPPTVSEPIVDAETDAICDNFLRSIGYSGICEIELKRDSRDGKVKLIEANPRLTGGGDAAPHAGVDTCWLHYLDMIGQKVTPVGPNGIDFHHIILRADARAIIPYVRLGLASWSDIARSYRGRRAFFDLDGNDWGYSMETFYRAGRSFVGSLLRKK